MKVVTHRVQGTRAPIAVDLCADGRHDDWLNAEYPRYLGVAHGAHAGSCVICTAVATSTAAVIAHAHHIADTAAGAGDRDMPVGYATGLCCVTEDLRELCDYDDADFEDLSDEDLREIEADIISEYRRLAAENGS